MEQIHETMNELEDLMVDNLCSNDSFVEHSKEDCNAGIMDSHEPMDIDENETEEKLNEVNENNSGNDFAISNKEINDSVLSDNDMFGDSFDKNHADTDVESVLKSFDCANEKNLNMNLTEIDSLSNEKKSNEPCLFDLLQESNKESQSIDERKVSRNAVPAATLSVVEMNADSSKINVNITDKLIEIPSKGKPDFNNRDFSDELSTAHDNTDIVDNFENNDTISNGVDTFSLSKLAKISNKYSAPIKQSDDKKINDDGIEDDVTEKNNTNKDDFIPETLFVESEHNLEGGDEKVVYTISSSSPTNSQISHINRYEGDKNLEIHDDYNGQFKRNSLVENGVNRTQDSCLSKTILENGADEIEKEENDDILDEMEKEETNAIEILDNSETKNSCTDLTEIVLESNSDHDNDENKITNPRACLKLSENLLENDGITDVGMVDFHYANNITSKPNVILDSTFNAPQNSSTIDKVVVPSVVSGSRISPRSLPNRSMKSSISSSVKKHKNAESVKLRTCHVNLKKVHINDSYSPFQSKPNLALVKKRLDEMLYESTKQEECGIKEIKKMRQERSRAYGNLLKELTRVKNKMKSMK